MTAAFSYYIQGLLRRRGNLRQRFRLAACDAATSRCHVSGGRGTPRPYDRTFLPLCWTRLTSILGRRSSKSQGSTGRSPPSDGRVFLRRPAASGCRGPQGPILAFGWRPFFPPCHARRHLKMSSKAWLGLLHGPGPGEQGADGWRRRCAEAAAIEVLRWRRKGRRRIAARPDRRLLEGLGLLGSAGRRPRLLPGPPAHPAQAGGRGGPEEGGRTP